MNEFAVKFKWCDIWQVCYFFRVSHIIEYSNDFIMVS